CDSRFRNADPTGYLPCSKPVLRLLSLVPSPAAQTPSVQSHSSAEPSLPVSSLPPSVAQTVPASLPQAARAARSIPWHARLESEPWYGHHRPSCSGPRASLLARAGWQGPDCRRPFADEALGTSVSVA